MNFQKLDAVVEEGIRDGAFPGAAYAVGYKGKVVHQAARGRHTYCPESLPTTAETIWDLASVSKVVGTTTAAMILFDRGKLNFDQPVAEILPEFGQNDKSKITLRNLLLHDSGLAAFRPYHQTLKTPEACLKAIYAEKLTYPTGTKMVYSDLGMITFGKVVETLAGRTFTAFLNEVVFQPLGMGTTLYDPVFQLRERCAPTEAVEPWRLELRRARGLDTDEIRALEKQPDGSSWIKGEVHDPTAMLLGGVAGHAGLFSTVGDLCKFMSAMVRGGNGLVKESTIKLFTRRQSSESSRGLGWDTRSEGSSSGDLFPADSFGHTGYTGTSVWGAASEGLYAVLLTNRVHPTAANTQILAFRRKFHDAVYRAIHA